MTPVFADAVYFIALINSKDRYRDRALNFSAGLHFRFVTTDWILIEVADALASSHARKDVRGFIRLLRKSPSCEIVPFSSELFDRALNHYHSRPDKDWSLTDCASFEVMRERGIGAALTVDKHFEQAGFTELLK
ncbi:hypothetical protein BH09SUM1_BH09SUM1_21010 [soil metagenome]